MSQENKEKESIDKVVDKDSNLNNSSEENKENVQEESISQVSPNEKEDNEREEKTVQDLEKELEETKDKMLRECWQKVKILENK